MSTWPASLPQAPLQDGFNEEFANNVLATQMDQGPDKYRKRTTSNVQKFDTSFLMSSAQLTTFKTFFDDTISGGAATFDFPNPRTSTVETFRIDMSKGPPKIIPLSGGQYRVSFGMERLPQ